MLRSLRGHMLKGGDEGGLMRVPRRKGGSSGGTVFAGSCCLRLAAWPALFLWKMGWIPPSPAGTQPLPSGSQAGSFPGRRMQGGAACYALQDPVSGQRPGLGVPTVRAAALKPLVSAFLPGGSFQPHGVPWVHRCLPPWGGSRPAQAPPQAPTQD